MTDVVRCPEFKSLSLGLGSDDKFINPLPPVPAKARQSEVHRPACVVHKRKDHKLLGGSTERARRVQQSVTREIRRRMSPWLGYENGDWYVFIGVDKDEDEEHRRRERANLEFGAPLFACAWLQAVCQAPGIYASMYD